MNGQLLTIVAVYLSLVAALGLLAAAGVPCVPALRAGVVVGELLLVLQALIDVVSLMGGHHPAEPATHLGYLAVSVTMFPLLLGRAAGRRAVARPSRADHVVAAFAAAVTAVVSLRLHATWHA